MKWWGFSLRRVGMAVAVILVLAAALFYGGLQFRRSEVPGVSADAARSPRLEARVPAAEAKIRVELDRIRAANEPITIEEVAPPPVPDAQNAALLYEKAYNATDLNLDEIHTIEALFRPAFRGAADDPVAASRAIVARNRQATALVYQAAERPGCCFPLDWEKADRQSAYHIALVGHIFWPVVATAVLHSRDGDLPGALRALRVGIRLGDAITDEPSQPCQWARYTTYRASLEALLVVLAAHRVTPDLARPLYDQLAAIQIMEPFARGLIGDRAWAFTHYRKSRAMAVRSRDILAPPEWTLEASGWLPLLGERIALADQPYRAVAGELEALDARAHRFEHTTDMTTQYLFPRDTAWATQPFQQRDEAMAQIGLAQMALALKAYQAQHGGYPDSLESLRKAVGWKIPGDPFSGRDFGCRRENGVAIFYSIGPDLRDNNGTPRRRGGGAPAGQQRTRPSGAGQQPGPAPGAPRQRPPARPGTRPGDLVWRLAA